MDFNGEVVNNEGLQQANTVLYQASNAKLGQLACNK